VSTVSTTGGTLLCATLADLGIDTLFGLPGTQTVGLYDEFRASPLRTIVSTHELAATFMAIGYYRSSGRVAAVSTIPGPGFTYALTGLAEARFDSAALLLLVVKPRMPRGNRFRFQDIDHRALAAPIAKAFVRIESVDEMASGLRHAYRTAVEGEPGPVVVELQAEILNQPAQVPAPLPGRAAGPGLSDADLDALCDALTSAGRRVLLVGQGAADASADVTRLADRLGALVVATSSGRGIVAEDHPRVLVTEYSIHDVRVVNDLCRAADVVLALGVKLGHNGTAGFRLELPADKLLQIDASSEVLGANYPARLLATADVPTAVSQISARLSTVTAHWTDDEVAAWRARAAAARTYSDAPTVAGAPGGMEEVLGRIRAAVPRDACIVTDSGLHQMTTRTWWTALGPRGLVTPADFQSMGFGLPAAVGAAIACPTRTVIAVIGDGGLAMSGMELATAVREGVRLLVVVCNDRGYGLIRRQQVALDTVPFAVDFASPDICALAAALGADADTWPGTPDLLQRALAADGVFVLELVLTDHPDQRRRRNRRRAKETVRRFIGDSTIARLRRWLGV
jgi:thiamine pyrophosphate-dependent acetolactate synthase large subunit-like protein